jgi:hypothetical protein
MGYGSRPGASANGNQIQVSGWHPAGPRKIARKTAIETNQ